MDARHILFTFFIFCIPVVHFSVATDLRLRAAKTRYVVYSVYLLTLLEIYNYSTLV